jgi:hypothetical protein
MQMQIKEERDAESDTSKFSLTSKQVFVGDLVNGLEDRYFYHRAKLLDRNKSRTKSDDVVKDSYKSIVCTNCLRLHSDQCDLCALDENKPAVIAAAFINGSPCTYRDRVMAFLQKEKFTAAALSKDQNNHFIATSYISTPFQNSPYFKYNSSEPIITYDTKREDFLLKRRDNLIKDEINLFKNRTTSKYFFKNLNELKVKSAIEREQLKLMECPAPESEKFRERFAKFKSAPRISTDVADFINKNSTFKRIKISNGEIPRLNEPTQMLLGKKF